MFLPIAGISDSILICMFKIELILMVFSNKHFYSPFIETNTVVKCHKFPYSLWNSFSEKAYYGAFISITILSMIKIVL